MLLVSLTSRKTIAKALFEEGGPLADMNFSSAKTYGWVARQVATSTRVDVLSFDHHKMIAALSPPRTETLARSSSLFVYDLLKSSRHRSVFCDHKHIFETSGLFGGYFCEVFEGHRIIKIGGYRPLDTEVSKPLGELG